jgi:hypothetical protein
MGNEPPKKKVDKISEKQRFELACMRVKAHVEIQRDRRQNEALQKEK